METISISYFLMQAMIDRESLCSCLQGDKCCFYCGIVLILYSCATLTTEFEMYFKERPRLGLIPYKVPMKTYEAAEKNKANNHTIDTFIIWCNIRDPHYLHMCL